MCEKQLRYSYVTNRTKENILRIYQTRFLVGEMDEIDVKQ